MKHFHRLDKYSLMLLKGQFKGQKTKKNKIISLRSKISKFLIKFIGGNYSGKKKRHTKKNTVITTETKRIICLGPTVESKKHYYGEFKDEFPTVQPTGPPQLADYCIYADLGYIGIAKAYPWLNIKMSKKKPKGGELTGRRKTKKQGNKQYQSKGRTRNSKNF